MPWRAVIRLLRPLTRIAEREFAAAIAFLSRHYTFLAVMALSIVGGAFFFAECYLSRYKHWNYWLWKSRAVTKTINFAAILFALKLMIGGM